MTIQYCKFCGAYIVHDILTGFCCDQCKKDYEELLDKTEEDFIQAVND